jgi:hypothetical protein
MSELAPSRALPRGRPVREPSVGRRLRAVAPPQTRGGTWFLTLCAALLLGGFVGVLVLNTAMAKGTYTMRDLQRRSDELADTEDALRQSVQAVSGPGPLAREARLLGMVPAESAAFLRLSDGKVLGVAVPARPDETFRVITEERRSAGAAPTRATPTAPSPTTRPVSTPTPTRPAGVTAVRKPATGPGSPARTAAPSPTSGG